MAENDPDDDDDPAHAPLPALSYEQLHELDSHLWDGTWEAVRLGLCPILSEPGAPGVIYGPPEGDPEDTAELLRIARDLQYQR
jgi:hypothetical protein